MIILPLITGNYRLNPQLFVENTLYTGGITIIILLISDYILPERFINTSFSNK